MQFHIFTLQHNHHFSGFFNLSKKWSIKLKGNSLFDLIDNFSTLVTFFYFVHKFIHVNHHRHHVMPLAWISLTLSRHFSLLFIASGRSSGLHPVSSHSCCMYVRAGRPAFARPYVGVHRSTSLMSSSLLLQQCPACLVRLTCIVFMMGGRWPYSWCLVGCCHQDLFNIALWFPLLKFLFFYGFVINTICIQISHNYFYI